MPNFDIKKEIKYLMYLDANNLYGWAMKQKLPIGQYKWVENLEQFTKQDYWNKFDINDDVGYMLEVDLEYPKELHDLHNDFPLAVESKVITYDDLSPYTKVIKNDKHNSKTEKLVPTLSNKYHYVLHSRNLKIISSKEATISWSRSN